MTEPVPFIPEFRIVDPERLSIPLRDALQVTRQCQEDRERRRKVTWRATAGLALAIPIGLIDLLIIAGLRYTNGSFDFLYDWLSGGLCLVFAVVAVGGGIAWLLSGDGANEVPTPYLKGWGVTAVFAIVVMFLPAFPLLIVVTALVYGMVAGREQSLSHPRRSPQEPLVSTLPSACMQDNRFQDLEILLSHIAAWNQFAELLNRMRLKLTHGQIPDSLVADVCRHLTAMRAEEDFLFSRVRYCEELAAQGLIGTRTTQLQLGPDLVHDLSGRLDDMRTHMEQLRQIDLRTAAALEVHVLGR